MVDNDKIIINQKYYYINILTFKLIIINKRCLLCLHNFENVLSNNDQVMFYPCVQNLYFFFIHIITEWRESDFSFVVRIHFVWPWCDPLWLTGLKTSNIDYYIYWMINVSPVCSTFVNLQSHNHGRMFVCLWIFVNVMSSGFSFALIKPAEESYTILHQWHTVHTVTMCFTLGAGWLVMPSVNSSTTLTWEIKLAGNDLHEMRLILFLRTVYLYLLRYMN